MKKFYMALAAVSLLASCSKENVEPQPKPQEQDNVEAPIPADTPAGDASNTVRLSFQGDLEPFEIASEGLDGERLQGARTVETSVTHDQPVVGGKAKFINFTMKHEKVNADGKKVVPALMYLYDDQEEIAFWREVEVSEDGKSFSHEIDLNASKGTDNQKRIFKYMLDKKMVGIKMSIIFGYTDTNRRFTNKGAQLVTFANGKTTALPSNFVMLKSEGNPIEYRQGKLDRPNAIRIKDGARIKLKMQGYLLGIRFTNTFPAKMYRMNWTNVQEGPFLEDASGNKLADNDYTHAAYVLRPDAEIGLHFSGSKGTGAERNTLSALYETQIKFNSTLGRFQLEPAFTGPYRNLLNINTPGVTKYEVHNSVYYKVTGIGEDGLLKVPVSTDRQENKLDENEQIVLVYCPIPQDEGTISWKPENTYFYSGGKFGMLYSDLHHSYIGYRYLTGYNAFKKTKQGTEGRVYLPMFKVRPSAETTVNGPVRTEFEMKAYQKRIKNLKPA